MLAILSMAVSALALIIVIKTSTRTHKRALASALLLKRAEALRDEVLLIQIDNEQLRREGVWLDEVSGQWVARYTLTTHATSQAGVYAALAQRLPEFALKLAKDSWPHAAETLKGRTMSLIDHPIWPELVPLLKAQRYDRDGGHSHPRYRIEVKLPTGSVSAGRELTARLLQVEVACATCGRLIVPIRARRGAAFGPWYVAVSCELARRYGCARSKKSAAEYVRIVDAIHAFERTGTRKVLEPILF